MAFAPKPAAQKAKPFQVIVVTLILDAVLAGSLLTAVTLF